MADTEVLFYIIVIVVILVKLIFWSLYLCLRTRRQRRLRLRQAAAQVQAAHGTTCYEEEPATPQPAFVYSGLPLPLPQTALINSLPEYQAEDPYKTDQPPPSYGDLYDVTESDGTSHAQELDSFAEIEASDTERLLSVEASDR